MQKSDGLKCPKQKNKCGFVCISHFRLHCDFHALAKCKNVTWLATMLNEIGSKNKNKCKIAFTAAFHECAHPHSPHTSIHDFTTRINGAHASQRRKISHDRCFALKCACNTMMDRYTRHMKTTRTHRMVSAMVLLVFCLPTRHSHKEK